MKYNVGDMVKVKKFEGPDAEDSGMAGKVGVVTDVLPEDSISYNLIVQFEMPTGIKEYDEGGELGPGKICMWDTEVESIGNLGAELKCP